MITILDRLVMDQDLMVMDQDLMVMDQDRTGMVSGFKLKSALSHLNHKSLVFLFV
jgi:hypothetical protein